MQHKRALEILLVEDNRADVRLTVEALREAQLDSNLFVARDGREALERLRGGGAYASAMHPDIILLDLNLPKLGGRGVLNEIKRDEALRHIPVIVLTTSDSEEDVLALYQAQANCYITKPVDFDEFIDVIRAIEGFWSQVAKLPRTAALAGRA
jgi:two-component system, chemotaxis family, response regulator Rcp1